MDRNRIVCTIYIMTISNKNSITGPIPALAVGGVGLTSTNYRTCITLIYIQIIRQVDKFSNCID